MKLFNDVHKLEDDDIIKLIPRIVDGKIEWAKKVDMLACLETGNGYNSVVVFDTEGKWASKIVRLLVKNVVKS